MNGVGHHISNADFVTNSKLRVRVHYGRVRVTLHHDEVITPNKRGLAAQRGRGGRNRVQLLRKNWIALGTYSNNWQRVAEKKLVRKNSTQSIRITYTIWIMSGAEELDTGNFPTTQTPLVVQPTVDANNAVIFQTPALCPGWTKEKKTGDYLHKKKAKSSAKWPSETNLVASAARFFPIFPHSPAIHPPKLGERWKPKPKKKETSKRAEWKLLWT